MEKVGYAYEQTFRRGKDRKKKGYTPKNNRYFRRTAVIFDKYDYWFFILCSQPGHYVEEGRIYSRSIKGCLRGYILSRKGKTYLLSHYEADMRDYLTGARETNHIKSEKEKRLRLHRMSLAWTHFFMQGCYIFPSQKPKIFSDAFFIKRETGTYYGSQELKEGTDKIKASRACGLFLKNGEAFVVYQTMENLLKWAKKTEYAMRAWVEGKALRHNLSWGSDAMFLGNSMAFLLQILKSTGGLKNQLFQVDDYL